MLGIIVRREYLNVLRSKSALISNGVVIVLILIAGVIGRFLADGMFGSLEEKARPQVALTTEVEALAPGLEAVGAKVEQVGNVNPETWAREHENDLLITGAPDAPQVYSTSTDAASDGRLALITSVASNYVLTQHAVPQEVQEALATVSATHITAVTTDEKSDDPFAYLIAMLSVIFTFMAATMGISILAQGIVEEKASRVVEILLATVKPRTLLLGKILGLGSAVLTIMCAYVAASVASIAISGMLPHLGVTFEASWLWYIPLVLVSSVIGYFTYAALTGGVAATVSRQEDLGGVIGPITIFLLVPFYLAIFLVPNQPDALITKILSYIPLFSPVLMPARVAFADVAAWEIALALALALAAIPLLALLAGKIYEASILRVGERVKLSSIFAKKA